MMSLSVLKIKLRAATLP